MLDETIDAQASPVGACASIHPQPEKAIGLLNEPLHPIVNNLSIAYSANTMQSTLMTKMCKLLSLKSLLGYVKQKATDLIKWEQQFGVVLHRIDEVLNELSDTYENLRDRIFQFKKK
jgi:hypothetical protein